MPGTVLIVDDHQQFREAARALLEASGFTVVGEAADGASALAAVDALSPAVVLLDIKLPDTDGFEVAARLAAGLHRPKVILISTRSAVSFRRRLAESTAAGFIAKSELSGQALAALCG